MRAKKTLRAAGTGFAVPRGAEREARLASVLEVVYLIFNEGYAATAGEDLIRPALCAEAQRLGRILAGLMPEDPEVWGLLALMELQASRLRGADRARRRGGAAAGAEPGALGRGPDPPRPRRAGPGRGAGRGGGPYALQAALAACHARARRAEETDWRRIAALYDRLRAAGAVAGRRAEPGGGAQHGLRAGGGAGAGRRGADDALAGYAPLPAARGDFLLRAGRAEEARAEFRRAAELSRNARERAFLLGRAAACEGRRRAAAGSGYGRAGSTARERGVAARDLIRKAPFR